MSSVRMRTRTTRRGDRRYMVAYRLGGRYGRDRSAGTFETLTLARTRRMKVMELIARGEHDQIPELANPELATTAEPAGTWTELHQQWIDGTHNLKPSTKNTYQQHGRSLAQVIGERDPTRFDWKDCLDLVTNLVQRGLAPRTVKAYIDTLKLALDFAGVEPNPARDRRVKLPRQPAKQPRIPSRAHIQAIRTHLPQHLLIPFDTLEATGIRVGELNNLTWADLDTAESRARIAQGKTASARRWVQLPPQRSPTKSSHPAPRGHRHGTPPVSHATRTNNRLRDRQSLQTRRHTPLPPPRPTRPLDQPRPQTRHATGRGRPRRRPRTPSDHPRHLQPRHHRPRRPPPPRLGNARAPHRHHPNNPPTRHKPRNARSPCGHNRHPITKHLENTSQTESCLISMRCGRMRTAPGNGRIFCALRASDSNQCCSEHGTDVTSAKAVGGGRIATAIS